jgi:hypothetical protein
MILTALTRNEVIADQAIAERAGRPTSLLAQKISTRR